MPTISRSRALLAVATIALTALATGYPMGAAKAQVIFQPAAVSTDMGTSAGNLNNTINQSGLSALYTSGVTPQAGYNATHNGSSGNNIWISNFIRTGTVTFDLGVDRNIGSFLLWNEGAAFRILSFSLSSSNVSDFSSGVTNLGNYNTNTTGGVGAVNLETFSFTASTARYFRMTITANTGQDFTSFGEAAFAGTVASVNGPEPATFALLALGITAVTVRLRRKRDLVKQ